MQQQGNIVRNIVLKNSLPVNVYFAQQTRMNKLNISLKVGIFYGLNTSKDLESIEKLIY